MQPSPEFTPSVSEPLVIDLDGTLLRSDLVLETGLVLLRDRPHRFLNPLLWLLRGKSTLKHEMFRATEIDVTVLPYDEVVIKLIRTEREQGRRVVLATASHRRLADRVASHLQLFDEVIAIDADRNLSSQAKRDALVAAYGERGFDYVGNAAADLPVWQVARQAYVVNPDSGGERRARSLGNVAAVLRSSRADLSDWIGALRLHHWLKNLLVFVPLLASHRYTELPLLLDAGLAFLCFGLCASSVYVLNDLLDLGDDRHHVLKRLRPFASGRLSISAGLALVPVLVVAAFALALWQLPRAFAGVLASYYVITLVYSLALKRIIIVDVITLTGLYTLRLIAGSAALGITLSFWLLAFSMFMFLSLALVKRHAELFEARAQGRPGQAGGRGYVSDDLPIIAVLGGAAGYMAVLVLALYINDVGTAKLYRKPEIIWLACPLVLTWVSRVWMLAHRGRINEDPVIFAVRDRVSLALAGLMAIVFWAAT